MRFLANGDFNFPFDWMLYWIKHFYIWSFQSGTPNPDGLIRLPGRIFNFIVFGASGNVGVSYFYLVSSLAVAFLAFYFFARNVLHIKKTSILLIGSLFFACNPIFLGNLAKVGLVLAAAMLPLCILAIHAAFERKRFRYFLPLILCLNLSFLHPYTFTVNALIGGIYFACMAWKHRLFVVDNLHKFALVAIVGILLNLYFVLPLMSMGTVSKDVISSNVTPSPVDYTALVGVSNTGDFFTGFSLSKNVFKDFEFYNATYQSVYFFAVFMLYVLLIGLYLQVEKRLNLADKKRLGVCFGAFLVFIALAATTVMHIDTLIKFLISMPGGWAFRSPLKWQLYIPLMLFTILVILLNYVKERARFVAIYAGLLALFVLMNAYLVADVYKKILTPRSLINFSALANMDLSQKTVLFINNGPCMDYMRQNPSVTSELNQVFTSKNTQLKHVLMDNADTVNLASYDYVIGCKQPMREVLDGYRFHLVGRYADNAFQLYANKDSRPHVFALERVFALEDQQHIAKRYHFATKELGTDFAFVTPAPKTYPRTGLQDIFSTVTPATITNNATTSQLPASGDGKRQLRIRAASPGMYYALSAQELHLSSTMQPGLKPIPETRTIDLPSTSLDVRYEDRRFAAKNLVSNASFESGLWQKKVSDCYDYDNDPDIAMQLDSKHAVQGRQSLQLQARKHIACTGPQKIRVHADDHYLLSFAYQSIKGKYAGYQLRFNDSQKTTLTERMQNNSSNWRTFGKEITAPKGATAVNVLLYAYPDGIGEQATTVRYDQISLTPIPPTQDRFYIVTQSSVKTRKPRAVQYTVVDPTKKHIRITGATQPFYLATAESYHQLWQLSLQGKPVANKQHFKLNNTMNGWYIAPDALCAQGNCTKQHDGSYDFEVTMEFRPQRSFYIGAMISGLTFVGSAVYFIRSHRRDKQSGEGQGTWRWR